MDLFYTNHISTYKDRHRKHEHDEAETKERQDNFLIAYKSFSCLWECR